jgi:hypothetical protein
LKWIPTDNPTATQVTKYKKGYYQGAYNVPDTKHYSIVSLKDDWVNHQFDPSLLTEIKEQGVKGSCHACKFIPIPPGKSKTGALPPNELLHFMRRCKFQQGSNSTCLLDAFCSAMHDFGCTQQVYLLQTNQEAGGISQASKNAWSTFCRLSNSHFKKVGLHIIRQKKFPQVCDLLQFNDAFVIIATLKASDSMEGQHAVAIFNGGIYDANCPYVLKKTQESLDWCCGEDDVTCIGIVRSYQMLPVNQKHTSKDMHYVIQLRNAKDCNVRGWVASTRGVEPLIQFADGTKRHMNMKELSLLPRVG